MTKRGIGTLEALRAVSRAWRVPSRALGFGGLKDRHGTTTQFVTIPNGPRRNLDEPAFRLTYEGRSDVPMSRTVLEGNDFRVRVRDLSREEADALVERFRAVAESGLPAYFDDQRFGSLRGGGGFAVLHLLRGDAEAALRAVIASPDKADRKNVRERKRAIRDGWGDWGPLLPRLAGSPMRGPVAHLARRPGDFEGAFAALPREERRLLSSAYASSVWNRALVRILEGALPERERVVLRGAAGALVYPKGAMPGGALGEATLPMPAPTARADDPGHQAALEAALADDGLTLDRLRLPPRLGLEFRPTRRPLVFRPGSPRAEPPRPDERNRGRWCVDLAFRLGRGLYATILLKRLTHGLGRERAAP
jgi:tRNA pseudouridine13 synthase